MKKILSLVSFILLLQGCTESDKSTADQSVQKPTATFATEGKTALVYTTASGTDLRLTLTDTASFSPAQQALEGNISVFINPEKTFQDFIGIGGAITDASAEVFAKLSPEKQQEFLNAYYNKENGIGYSLMRTTIHSSD